ncbi:MULTISPECIES: hypothetical protein [unclassified Undibacterium]|nr:MULTISPECIES: hypothetical protein [unclassified Undibacterium]MEB0138464.1 hypothetical protein [Undibacterium sp. CCC2.1]MEB0177526.1 hypothetical protein [Undibacterium sp. CCC3.4]MEB0216158.1 hypothetical protein [Undibacterium sp. 5I2]WPX42793.1 hypothetical protein RHM61_15595 [Undibacterium sp. CCC3.4]
MALIISELLLFDAQKRIGGLLFRSIKGKIVAFRSALPIYVPSHPY